MGSEMCIRDRYDINSDDSEAEHTDNRFVAPAHMPQLNTELVESPEEARNNDPMRRFMTSDPDFDPLTEESYDPDPSDVAEEHFFPPCLAPYSYKLLGCQCDPAHNSYKFHMQSYAVRMQDSTPADKTPWTTADTAPRTTADTAPGVSISNRCQSAGPTCTAAGDNPAWGRRIGPKGEAH